ncbi:tetratricopeptide repeat protein [Phragmitibacter flavus]|nr:tetratricopeptide repeat protein [Phragmitibacter flavus]
METTTFDSAYQRAQMLYERSRWSEAAEWFQRALEAEPNHPHSHAMLAMCWIQDPTTLDRAVGAAQRAVALDPEDSHLFAILSIVQMDSSKPGQYLKRKEALASAKTAVQLDPDSDFAHAAQAHAHLRLDQPREAETAARTALSLNPDNTMATQALSAALLQLGKREDHRHLIQNQLTENPDDDQAHVSAGWQALADGRHQDANNHFREALRLDPMNEVARSGLVESFRARSFIYRWYVQYCQWIARISGGRTTAIMIGGFIAYKILGTTLKQFSPGLATALMVLWLTLVLWSFLARGIGSALMLKDRFARLALQPKEKWEGICLGLLILLALTFAGLTFVPNVVAEPMHALVLFLAAVPVASAFSNDHHIGRWIYAALAIIAAGCALIATPSALVMFQDAPGASLAAVALLIGVATTWLTSLRILFA